MEKNYNKIIDLLPSNLETRYAIKEIESKFSLLTSGQDSQPNLKLLNEINESYSRCFKLDEYKSKAKKLRKIKKLVSLGFSVKEVAKELGISSSQAYSIIKSENLSLKAVFNYQLIQNTRGIYIYTTSLRSLFQFYHLDKSLSRQENTEKLKKLGCRINNKIYHWYELPNYCFYQKKQGQDNWYVKVNEDSYNKILKNQFE